MLLEDLLMSEKESRGGSIDKHQTGIHTSTQPELAPASNFWSKIAKVKVVWRVGLWPTNPSKGGGRRTLVC